MESSDMRGGGGGGGFLSGLSSGFLDLESSPVQRHQQIPFGLQPIAQVRNPQGVENLLPMGLMEVKGPSQGGLSMCFGKGKGIASANDGNSSEEDEPSYNEDGHDDLNGSKGKHGSSSPWHRMKWTDSIVRLLIAVVSFVGDDGAHDGGGDGLKRKSGVLQKKGKWKTVSKVMISKGCHVSPQQCEDKFNDLNKRYKKLNDILGRGTSCRVVEDPTLMDSIPQLSAKKKEDVKKILSSKHLFYQEMCAYHNGQRIPNCSDIDLEAHSLPLVRCSKDNHGSEEEEAEENDDSEEDESDDEAIKAAGKAMEDNSEQKKQSEDGAYFWPQSTNVSGFEAEIASIFEDPSKTQWEKKQWNVKQMLQVQEHKINIQAEGIELEKRFFKWRQFCKKKERELERSRLENERMILENERMALLLKQKELEISLSRPDAALELGSINVDGLQGRVHIDLERHQ